MCEGGNSNITLKVLPTVVCARKTHKPRNIMHSYPHLIGKAWDPHIFLIYTFRVPKPKPHTLWSLCLWSFENTTQYSTHTNVKAVPSFKNVQCWTFHCPNLASHRSISTWHCWLITFLLGVKQSVLREPLSCKLSQTSKYRGLFHLSCFLFKPSLHDSNSEPGGTGSLDPTVATLNKSPFCFSSLICLL